MKSARAGGTRRIIVVRVADLLNHEREPKIQTHTVCIITCFDEDHGIVGRTTSEDAILSRGTARAFSVMDGHSEKVINF